MTPFHCLLELLLILHDEGLDVEHHVHVSFRAITQLAKRLIPM
jgi:hypothetical protein